MTTITYNKLVRDRIPEIIAAAGKKCVVKRLRGKPALRRALIAKLAEELSEYEREPNCGELADMQEVLDALIRVDGLTNQQVRARQKQKRRARGGFSKAIFLKQVKTN